MKSMILFLATLCLCCLLASGVEAQQQKKTIRPPQKVSQPKQTDKQRDADKAQTVAAQQEKTATRPDRTMTNDEKVLGWQSEKVILAVGDWTDHMPDFSGAGGRSLPRNDYNEKTGVIIESKLRHDFKGGVNLTITLDTSGEKIFCSSAGRLFFLSEIRMAQAFVGRNFWTKGTVVMRERSDGGWVDVDIAPTKQVTVTRVTRDDRFHKIELHLRADNQEGFLVVMEEGMGGGECLDKRFHLGDSCSRVWSPAPYFYEKDPHMLFPGWSKAIWGLIEKGEIAIGMTEQMAEAACGNRVEAGFVITNGIAGTIYSCRGKRFLMQNGKVTKYVE